MRREAIQPRPDWRSKVETLGLLFHQNDDGDYWNESACYRFTSEEIDDLEAATNDIHGLCLSAVEHVIENRLYADLGIEEAAIPAIEESWTKREPSVYGRFDLVYDGSGPAKLLEYNADTPTSLLEAAVIQWHWLQELYPDSDQFNSIWEGLVAAWPKYSKTGSFHRNKIHFACADSVEDFMTISVLRDTAIEAELDTEALLMSDIGWHDLSRQFVDLHDQPINTIFKLYPWEWMVEEEFAPNLLQTYGKTTWIEPIWKMLLSNKGILPILWQLNPAIRICSNATKDRPGP